jgi:hypothetical protein
MADDHSEMVERRKLEETVERRSIHNLRDERKWKIMATSAPTSRQVTDGRESASPRQSLNTIKGSMERLQKRWGT